MTTESLPVNPEITPPTTLLQETEKTLLAATTEAFGAVEKRAGEIITKYDGVVWDQLHTTKGMDAAKEARRELREFRTRVVDGLHSAIKAPLLTIGNLADTCKREIGIKLKAAEDIVDAPIKVEEARKAAKKAEEERIERERVAAIRQRITNLSLAPSRVVGQPAYKVDEALLAMQCCDLEGMAEFTDEAKGVAAQAEATLREMLASAQAQEAEAERQRQEHIRLEAERQERERQLAAERAELARQQEVIRQEAERRQAELDAQAAELRRQQDELAAQQKPAPAAEATPEPAPVLTPVAPVEELKQEPVIERTTPPRPSNEELVMLVAHHRNVAEDVAYGWLMEFPHHAEKKVA